MSPAGAWSLVALLAAQIVAGIVNPVAPGAGGMQLVHLLLADLLWITLCSSAPQCWLLQPNRVRRGQARLARPDTPWWPTPVILTIEAGFPMSRKVLIVTGDGGDSYEALYAYHRFLEAYWEPVLAAPSRRRLHMVFHDIERAGRPTSNAWAIASRRMWPLRRWRQGVRAIVILGAGRRNTCATTPACSRWYVNSRPRTS